MDWNNLVSWQHNSGYNSASNFPVKAEQLSIDSKPYAAVPSFTDQLHDAGSSRAHANEVHDARDAATGHSLASYTIICTTCSPASSTSESLAYTIG